MVSVKVMCGEFGEVTVIIGLVINFLAFVSPLLTLRDTLTYVNGDKEFLVDRILVFDVKGKCERRVQIQCV